MEYVVYSHGKYTKYIQSNNIYTIQSNKKQIIYTFDRPIQCNTIYTQKISSDT